MRSIHIFKRQRGASLVVSLIMLVLITLMMLTAFNLSSSNLKTVGNLQAREEATAAANAALEQVISTPTIFSATAVTPITVGNYVASVAIPECLYSTPVSDSTSGDQNPNIFNQTGGAGGSVRASGYVDTYWDVKATVSDVSSGASVEVHQGIRITLAADPNPCPTI